MLTDANDDENILHWKPGQPRQGVVDFGHKYGFEYNPRFEDYKWGRMTLEELKEFQSDPDNFQIEGIRSNRGHKNEKKREKKE